MSLLLLLRQTAAGTAYNRTADDTVAGSDTPARLLAASRLHADTATMGADEVARSLNAARTATDNVPIGADSIGTVSGQARVATDTSAVGVDTPGRVLVLVRGPPDTVSTADSITHSGTFTRTATDTTAVSDALNQGQIRRADDTATTADSVARSGTFTSALGDTVATTDAVSRSAAAPRTATDTTSASDSLARSTSHQRAVTETVVVSDSLFVERRESPQTLRPISDISGNWHGEDARTTTLYTSIDDDPFSDSTYVESPSNPVAADLAEFDLPSAVDPVTSSGHIVRYRYGGTATLVVELRQGATVVAAWTHTTPGAGPFLAEQTLSAAEADSITDYSDLRVRVRGAD